MAAADPLSTRSTGVAGEAAAIARAVRAVHSDWAGTSRDRSSASGTSYADPGVSTTHPMVMARNPRRCSGHPAPTVGA